MHFNNITKLLDRFRHLEPSDSHIKKAFTDIVFERFGETLPEKNIRVMRGVIYLNTHPTLKSELHMRKNELLDELNEKIGKQGIIRSIV